jgi:hypothetical protein
MPRNLFFPLSMLAAMLAACAGSKPEPKAQYDGPRLPAMARSSVGILLNHATELGLSREIVQRCEALDDSVAKSNAELERQLAELAEPKTPHQPGDGARRGGGQRGGRGMGGGGMGGGMGRPPRSGGPGASGSPNQPRAESGEARNHRQEQINDLRARITANDSAALAEAFELLDSAQQAHARTILDAEGVEEPAAPAEQP